MIFSTKTAKACFAKTRVENEQVEISVEENVEGQNPKEKIDWRKLAFRLNFISLKPVLYTKTCICCFVSFNVL